MGRFINADGYVSTGQGLLGYNVFAYCQNSPVSYFDPNGNRLVGVGIQGEITIGGISVGVELVIYFDPEVCDGSDFTIVMYTYSGYELSADQLGSIMALVDVAAIRSSIDSLYDAYGETDFLSYFESSALAQVLHGIFCDGGSATAALFIIDGFDTFDDPWDYSGKFVSTSLSGSVNGKTRGVYYSYADKCQAVGVKNGFGFSGSKNALSSAMRFSMSLAVTYYSDPYILCEVNLS